MVRLTAEELKSKYFTSPDSQFMPKRGFPYLQTIVTKDWDLIKRYMFFMIRNHQYQYLNLMYFKDESVPSEDIMMFLTGEDTAEDLFGSLPADARGSADFMKPRTIVRSEPMIEFGGFAKAIPRKSFSKS